MVNMQTTIKLDEKTKKSLDLFREYKNESYDEVLRKLVYVAKSAKKQPKLSQQTVRNIEKARKQIREGKFYTEEEANKLLGLS